MSMVYATKDGEAVRYDGWMAIATCYKCGIPFGMPRYFEKKRREDSESFYCPNGHGQVYRESEAARLKRKLDEERQARQRDKEQAAKAQDKLLDRLNATEADRRRIARRAKAGTCIECNRSFANVQDHMARQHGAKASGVVVHKRLHRGTGEGTSRCYKWNLPRERLAMRWVDVDCPACIERKPVLP